MSQFDLSDTIPIYKNAIDSLIDQIGKNISCYTKKEPESNFDSINGGSMKPDFKLDDFGYDDLYDIETFKCTITWTRRWDELKEGTIQEQLSRCVVKTQIENLPTILQADFVVPNSDVISYHDYKFKVASTPQPTGLRDDIYIRVFLEQII